MVQGGPGSSKNMKSDYVHWFLIVFHGFQGVQGGQCYMNLDGSGMDLRWIWMNLDGSEMDLAWPEQVPLKETLGNLHFLCFQWLC